MVGHMCSCGGVVSALFSAYFWNVQIRYIATKMWQIVVASITKTSSIMKWYFSHIVKHMDDGNVILTQCYNRRCHGWNSIGWKPQMCDARKIKNMAVAVLKLLSRENWFKGILHVRIFERETQLLGLSRKHSLPF